MKLVSLCSPPPSPSFLLEAPLLVLLFPLLLLLLILLSNMDKSILKVDKQIFLQVNALLEKHRSAHSVHSSIKEYVAGGGEEQLEEVQTKIASLQDRISSLQSRKQSLTDETKKIEREITNQRVS